MNEPFDSSLLLFPPEWVKAALVLALISVWIVIALFTYLNRHTKNRYFLLWTVAWMFYSVYLAASIGLEESPNALFLIMARRACIGISALFMFWGTAELAGRKRSTRELGAAILMILLWSYVAAYRVRREYWITLPVFILLAAASAQTGLICLSRRRNASDPRILGISFLLWGAHLLAFPFLNLSPVLMAASYLISAILCSLITVGMIVEQQLSLSEQNYQTLFNSASDAMFLVEHGTWRIREANASAQRISAGLVGRNLWDIFPELKDDGSPETDLALTAHRELRRPRPDGSSLVYEASANLMCLPQGAVVLLVARDVTERARAQESLTASHQALETTVAELRQTQTQVIQQERLRALGQMASGVAHDFNNALAKILGFNELLLCTPEHLGDPNKVRKYLQMVNSCGQEAVLIVNRLREFYRNRKDTDHYEPVCWEEVIEQAIVLTQPRWKDQMLAQGKTVQIALDLHPVPCVRGHAGDLREVLINLTLNAVDALPDGGCITYRLFRDDAHVVLEVGDTGTGMTEDVRQRCLEPFFTTKPGDCTGLGLAVVYGILQRHGAQFDIATVPGRGTTFRIRLPAAPTTEAAAAVSAPAPPEPSVTPLRILVVDDEPLILDIEQEYLHNDGHTVQTARNGREGLAIFQAGHFDLVLVDQSMPEMNGEELARWIKQVAPETPVILVTGFSELLKSSEARPTPVDLVVAKPFSAKILRQAVAKVTARNRRPRIQPAPQLLMEPAR